MNNDVLWFEEIGIDDVPVAGGKNASLGEMVRELGASGIRVPDGFATTADAYRSFLSYNDLEKTVQAALDDYHDGRVSLRTTGEIIREAIDSGSFPPALGAGILTAYNELIRRSGGGRISVAVRSSATAEDLPDASFAGQQETFLNVRSDRELLDACRHCFASLFTDRAISYRELRDIDHLQVALSVGVQRMVRSDLAGSGVMFSIDTESGFPRVVVVSGAWGLGETVVQGEVDPDKYMVFKPLLDDARAVPIIEKTRGAKAVKLVFGRGGSARTRRVETTQHERQAFVLNDDEIVQLARWAVVVEQHYGRPMDMEWAKDGETGELFLVQARPETVQARKAVSQFTVSRLTGNGELLVSGAAIGQAIASGEVCVIRDPADIEKFRDGAILVTEMTDPDWVPIMSRAAGIITDHGGSTSHAAIVSRELGIPAVVGTGDATHVLGDGRLVTLCCAEGEEGHVYADRIPFETKLIDVSRVPATRTRLMVNIASPAAAFEWWRLPARGVGLARMEFIINNLISVHPMALVHPERVTDGAERRRIAALTQGWEDPKEYFVDTLARGIAKLAAPYHPDPVIVRMSDFKTNEYAHLLGGREFEHIEENPMIGFRGASRYYDPRYREGFALECRALARVRAEFGFTNVIVMIPFCRTPREADRVLEVMAENGLQREAGGLQIYMMCEIPSNVISAEAFASRFDGFSIGSNDLTQLVLGVDRDSGELSALFDERDPAVESMIAQAIRAAHTAGIKIGICGQAPSNYPEFAQFLVREGIDSISLNPDSFLRTADFVAEAERALPGSVERQAAESPVDRAGEPAAV
jgi:pyruvate,water dikinase